MARYFDSRRRKPRWLGVALIDIMFAFGVTGIGFGFTKLFDHWVYYPFWPNIVDSSFLVAAACWILVRRKLGSEYSGYRRRSRPEELYY